MIRPGLQISNVTMFAGFRVVKGRIHGYRRWRLFSDETILPKRDGHWPSCLAMCVGYSICLNYNVVIVISNKESLFQNWLKAGNSKSVRGCLVIGNSSIDLFLLIYFISTSARGLLWHMVKEVHKSLCMAAEMIYKLFTFRLTCC